MKIGLRSYFILIWLFLCSNGFARKIVITDIDDTIRATNILKLPTIPFNILVRQSNAIPGMSETLQRLSAAGYEIHYVSAAPSMAKTRVRSFLRHNGFPAPENLNLRGRLVSSEKFKREQIQKIMESDELEELIMIGDNGQKDPFIYDKVASETKIKVQTFIHEFAPSENLQPNQKSFYNSLDLALQLRQSGTFTDADIRYWLGQFPQLYGSSPLVNYSRIPTDDLFSTLDQKADELPLELKKIVKSVIRQHKTNTCLSRSFVQALAN